MIFFFLTNNTTNSSNINSSYKNCSRKALRDYFYSLYVEAFPPARQFLFSSLNYEAAGRLVEVKIYQKYSSPRSREVPSALHYGALTFPIQPSS